MRKINSPLGFFLPTLENISLLPLECNRNFIQFWHGLHVSRDGPQIINLSLTFVEPADLDLGVGRIAMSFLPPRDVAAAAVASFFEPDAFAPLAGGFFFFFSAVFFLAPIAARFSRPVLRYIGPTRRSSEPNFALTFSRDDRLQRSREKHPSWYLFLVPVRCSAASRRRLVNTARRRAVTMAEKYRVESKNTCVCV